MLDILCNILCSMVWLCCASHEFSQTPRFSKRKLQSYILYGICVFILYTNFN